MDRWTDRRTTSKTYSAASRWPHNNAAAAAAAADDDDDDDANIFVLAPVLDDCLQHGSTPVLGPVWVSRGERFSPTGVREFLSGLIAYTKAKLKEAKRYQKQACVSLLLLLSF